MATMQELYNWLTANGAQATATEAASALNDTEAAIHQLFTEGLGTAFAYDSGSNSYTAIPGWVYVLPVGAGDIDALNALTAAICTSTTCNNDVDMVLAATGVTVGEWQRGLNNTDAILDMLRCGALRTKLQGLGLDVTKLDGMLDSCDKASLVNVGMITHYGVAGV